MLTIEHRNSHICPQLRECELDHAVSATARSGTHPAFVQVLIEAPREESDNVRDAGFQRALKRVTLVAEDGERNFTALRQRRSSVRCKQDATYTRGTEVLKKREDKHVHFALRSRVDNVVHLRFLKVRVGEARNRDCVHRL